MKPVLCANCGKPATCRGVGEAHHNTAIEAMCDDCCAHVQSDGWCKPIAQPATERMRLVRILRQDAVRAESNAHTAQDDDDRAMYRARCAALSEAVATLTHAWGLDAARADTEKPE